MFEIGVREKSSESPALGLIFNFHAGAKPPLQAVINVWQKNFQYGGQNARDGASKTRVAGQG